MTHLERGNEPKARVNRARRHFLGVAAAATLRAATLGALAATILPSAAKAQRGGWGGWGGWGRGHGHGGHGHGGGTGPACFLNGTSILTPTGEVRVEDLRIGDLVQTVDGHFMPILWIGRHSYRKSGFSWPKEVMPIRVMRGALGAEIPHKDLYLSPNHALFINGILVRVKELVNGTSITPALPAGQEVIEYFNLVLPTHEVILAEGARVETFLMKNRNYEIFTNFIEYERLSPGDLDTAMKPYAPIAGYEGGRQHLKALLGLALSPLIQVHDPVQDAYRQLALRAKELVG